MRRTFFTAIVALAVGPASCPRPPCRPGSRLGFVHGDLDAHAGAGTLAAVSAVITEDLHAQLCKTGEQTWELWRTDAGY